MGQKYADMDMSKPRTWVYKKDHEPQMIYQEQAPYWYKKGWRDSPAKIDGVKEDPGEVETDPEIKEDPGEVETDQYALPDNFGVMDSKELDNLADKLFNNSFDEDEDKVKLDARKKPETLRREILSLIEKHKGNA